MVDQFFQAIEVDKIYVCSSFLVKQAQGTSRKYDLVAQKQTKFKLALTQDLEVAPELVSPTAIADLVVGQLVDVIGVVRRDLGPPTLKKTGMAKEVEIVDGSQKAALLTLWGASSSSPLTFGGIVTITKLMVSNWRGLSLGTTSATSIIISSAGAELPEGIDPVGMMGYPLIGEEEKRKKMKPEHLMEISGQGFSLVVVKKIFYDGNITFLPQGSTQVRLHLRVLIQGQSGHRTVNVFDPFASDLLGHGAPEIHQLKEANDSAGLEGIFAQVEGKAYSMELKSNNRGWVVCDIFPEK